MITDKQAKANIRNAQKSKGPRTQKGKVAVSHNAQKHGLLSRETLLHGEDPLALAELGESLRSEFKPFGELETLLVDRIITLFWRLRRLVNVEAGLFTCGRFQDLKTRALANANQYVRTSLDELAPWTEMITDKQKHQVALHEAEVASAKMDAEEVALARVFHQDAEKVDAFGKLSRYEVTIERSFYRALHELQRLQVVRNGGKVPLPLAVDLDVAVSGAS